MSPRIQTCLALFVVVLAVAGLVVLMLNRKGKPGCGGDCGCATDRLKPTRGDLGK
jgi:hypothetical protein